MRIVLDLQCLQSGSRFRGIGRYALSLTKQILLSNDRHQYFLLFNESLGGLGRVSKLFEGLVPKKNLLILSSFGEKDVKYENMKNFKKREISEVLRESFISSMKPDVVHVFSIFEGYSDGVVTSINKLYPYPLVSATFYDLIPLTSPNEYLKSNPVFSDFYYEKLNYLKSADLLIAISQFSEQEAYKYLSFSKEDIVSIPLAVDDMFIPNVPSRKRADELKEKFNFSRKIITYSGGSDERKNLHRLVKAFAALPISLKSHHQLLFIGKFDGNDVESLKALADAEGLGVSDIVFSGYVDDKELVDLYNLSELYVFPSWHEGFGLPVLEAMSCGIPVIGANTSSIPEVIGLEEALFDPLSTASITHKIQQVLTNSRLKEKLKGHGLKQSKKFSWKQCAEQTVKAWESLYAKKQVSNINIQVCHDEGRSLKKSLTPLLKTESKILIAEVAKRLSQNYLSSPKRTLFVDISEFHKRDSATGVQRVVRSYLMGLLKSPPENFDVVPVYAAVDSDYFCAYGFLNKFLGDSTSGCVTDLPMVYKRGDVFFGLDMQHDVQIAKAGFYAMMRENGVVVKFLLYDLLPIQLQSLFKNDDLKFLHEKLLNVFIQSDGVISISKATADYFDEWIEDRHLCLKPGFQNDWVHIGADFKGISYSQGFPVGYQKTMVKIKARPSFLMVSTIEPRKQQAFIFNAVNALWQQGIDVNLVLVGKEGWKLGEFADVLRNHPENNRRLFWLEGISDEYLDLVYQASTALIAASLNEGFGLSLIEAAKHQLPLIVRDIPVFREVAGEHASYFKTDNVDEMVSYLTEWLGNYYRNQYICSDALQFNTWKESTEQLKQKLIYEHYSRNQILVDVSEIVKRDAKTGIQRVVRSVLVEWLKNPPAGYRVEPIYALAEEDEQYRYAREFTQEFSNNPIRRDIHVDEVVEFSQGDVFIGLDLAGATVVTRYQSFYQTLKNFGVKVYFVLYDLLPIFFSEFFPEGENDRFEDWLKGIVEADGVIAISKAVADEFVEWKNENGLHDKKCLVDYFHLGADIENSAASEGVPEEATMVLNKLKDTTSFLMVGTVEPRKGHAQVLKAFEYLWEAGESVNLVIVGKRGWLVDEFLKELDNHPMLNKKLFWLAGISDEYLDEVYQACHCLIAASYGEGFGLPLIEAAQRQMPIIARDIPIFKEVAGEHAYYFSDKNSHQVISQAALEWLGLYEKNQHPESDNMPWLTWSQSAQSLLKLIIE